MTRKLISSMFIVILVSGMFAVTGGGVKWGDRCGGKNQPACP